MEKKRRVKVLISVFMFIASAVYAAPLYAATAGLPFMENFSTTDLIDSAKTRANWSTADQQLRLPASVAHQWTTGDGATVFAADSAASRCVASGDVNGDGALDLVVGTFNHTNKLYINDGSGAFPSIGTDIGNETDIAEAIGLGDVDGDGDLDLVAAGVGVRLYLNNGNGSFSSTGVEIGSGGHYTWDIAFADVDSDGDLDLITGNDDTNKLYLNDGSGAFSTIGTDIGVESEQTRSVKMVDIDSDGDLDMFVGNIERTNKLYLNDGSGAFSATGIDVGSESGVTWSIALGDVDDDGDEDLIAGEENAANKLYLNDGSGVFSATGTNIGSAANTRSVALTDMDGDGDLDLIAANYNSLSKLYLNDGNGGFSTTGISINGISKVYEMTIGDFASNGSMDMAVVSFQDSSLLYLNNGSFASVGSPIGIKHEMIDGFGFDLGDVDSDGDLDLVVSQTFYPNKLYLNDGSGAFSATGTDIGTEDPADDVTYSIKLGDVDDDGDLDLVAGNGGAGASAKLYLNNGSGVFSDTGVAIGSVMDSYAVELGDIDGDGNLDMAVAGNYGSFDRVYLNTGSGDFSTEILFPDSDLTSSFDVALGDVDNDGDLDVVVGRTGATNKLYLYDGGGVFIDMGDIHSDVHDTEDVDLGDLDGDGYLDMVAWNKSGMSRYYLNNGSGVFTASGVDISDGSLYLSAGAIGDIDNDGDLDLVTGLYDNTGNRAYINDGSGIFSATFMPAGSDDKTETLVFGDIDGDGDADLLSANYAGEVKLYLRDGGDYATNLGSVVSQAVDGTIGDIDRATLSVTENVPNNTSIDYYLSNNGGTKWHKVKPGVQFVFPSSASDLRWKAELHSLSPIVTPSISQIDVVQNLAPVISQVQRTGLIATAHPYRISDNEPPLAVDGDLNTLTFTTPSYTTIDPSYFGVYLTSAQSVNNLRMWKTNGQGNHDLVIQYTTDAVPDIAAGTWQNVSNLTNGWNGTELLTAAAVNADGTVTDESQHGSWASLSFTNVSATGIRIGFSYLGTYNHYPVHEFQLWLNTPASITTSAGSYGNLAILISDPDGDPLSWDISTAAANGTATVDADGNVSYLNNANFAGVDAFTVRATDSYGESVTLQVDVNVVDQTAPVISLLGSSTVIIEAGSSYTDEGATASDNIDGDISADIVRVNPVNTAVLGNYTVTYNVNDAAGNAASQVTRTVTVQDTTIPVISMLDNTPLTIAQGSLYTDPGATATDNADVDITANIVTVNSVDTAVIGSYTVTYNVTDLSGNAASEVVRTVNVQDATIPIITLLGSSNVTFESGSSYIDAGATALDDADGDISVNIIIVNPVKTVLHGNYTVTYNVTDSDGNAATQVMRTVTVSIVDVDSDNMDDNWEIANFGDISATATADPDSDGLTNLEEYRLATDPNADNALLTDADGDKMPDSWETTFFASTSVNPFSDADGDGILNIREYFHATDPTIDNSDTGQIADTDSDGIPDDVEIANGTDPAVSDATSDPDGDSLTNMEEYYMGTGATTDNELMTDTDNDGIPDLAEIAAGLDPSSDDSASYIDYMNGMLGMALTDGEGDGLPDLWEIANALDPLADNSASDTDGDGINDVEEYALGLSPIDGNLPPAQVTLTTEDGTRFPTSGAATISFNASSDPEGMALTYYATLYEGLEVNSTPLELDIVITPGSGYTPSGLSADTIYTAVIRANDGYADSPITLRRFVISDGTISGDINYDATVDGYDLVLLSVIFGMDSSDSAFNPFADIDLNGDGTIDGSDLAALAANFGQQTP